MKTKQKLKKLMIAGALCIAALLALSGCSGSQDTPTDPNAQDPTQQEQPGADQNNQDDQNNGEQQQPASTVAVKDIAGKSAEKVAAKLGEPMQTQDNSYFYKSGAEVTYVDNKAAIITIIPTEKIKDADFDAMFQAIGLKTPKAEPATTDASYVWQDVSGYYQITIFRNSGNVDYYQIITEEKYK